MWRKLLIVVGILIGLAGLGAIAIEALFFMGMRGWLGEGPAGSDPRWQQEEMAELTEEIARRPHDFTLYLKRARAYNMAGQRDLEIGDLTTATRLAPSNPACWYVKANACERAGRKAEAVQAYQRMLELLPASSDARIENWRSVARSRLTTLGVTTK